jgi:hypothetical protein
MLTDPMGSFFIPLEPGQAHVARLSAFRLMEPLAAANEKLLGLLSRHASVDVEVRFHQTHGRMQGRDWAAHLKKLRKAVAQHWGIEERNVVLHGDADDRRRVYFLARPGSSIGGALRDNAVKTSRRIFEMLLQSLILRDGGAFADALALAVGPSGRSTRPFLLVSSRAGKHQRKMFLDCLELLIKLDRHDQLLLDCKRAAFVVPLGEDFKASSVLPVRVGTSLAKLTMLDDAAATRLDARSSPIRKAIKEISFELDNVRQSRWHALSQLMTLVELQLRSADVKLAPVEFEATHFAKGRYLTMRHIELPRSLVIVLAKGLMADAVARREIEQTIQEAVSAQGGAIPSVSWTSMADLTEPLSSANAYLFLNPVVDAPIRDQPGGEDGASLEGRRFLTADGAGMDLSCTVRGSPELPERAYALLSQGRVGLADVDLYTRIKYKCVVGARAPQACLQGMNVSGAVAELKDGPEIETALVELAMKWALVSGRMRVPTPLPLRTLQATYTCARRRTDRTPELESVAHIVAEAVPGSCELTLRSSHVPPGDHAGIAQAIEEIPLIGTAMIAGRRSNDDGARLSGLRNDTFILRSPDCDRGETCLVVYYGPATSIPRIIGASDQPPLHEQVGPLLDAGPPERRFMSRGKTSNFLPYYIEGFRGQRGRKDFVFIETKNPLYLRYFVPPMYAVESTIGFSRLYDLMLYRKSDRRRERPLPIDVEHPLVRSYFSLLTQDVVRRRGNSKHTFLRKLASLVSMG